MSLIDRATQTVLDNLDVPVTSTTIDPLKSMQPSGQGDAGAGPGTTVTDMYLRNKFLPMFLTNKDTRFENLVFAITSGYASNPNPVAYRTDEEFATKACNLARAIAFEMDKYTSL